MNWIAITASKQLEEIIEASKLKPCIIYKHSSRCSMSEMMLYVLEDEWDFADNDIQSYYLDILQFRNLAAEVADKFQVYHQSPQLLLIKNGECIYDEDHRDISVEELHEHLEESFWKV